MAKVGRNDAEAEDDRLFLAGLIQAAGPDLSCVEAWKLLNDRRSKRARAAALKAGKTKQEADRAGLEARLTVQTVRRDVRILIGRAQQAGLAGAAVFLDDQIAALRDEAEATHLMDEQIALDIERSRSIVWSRTSGTTQPGATKHVQRFMREEAAANAALYGRLQENMRRRASLRAEERLLRFGRQSLPATETDEELSSYAELVTNLDDPEAARDAALALMRRRIRELERAESVPLSGDMMALEKMRLQNLDIRIRNFREYVRLPREEGGGEHRSFEVMFERAEPRLVGPPCPKCGRSGDAIIAGGPRNFDRLRCPFCDVPLFPPVIEIETEDLPRDERIGDDT